MNRLRALAQRIAKPLSRAARRVADVFPFTPLGLTVALLSAFALWRYGLGQIDLLYIIIGSVGLALCALTLFTSGMVALGLFLSLRHRKGGEALRLECAYAARTGFSLPTLWYVPFVKLSWHWVDPEARVKTISLRRRLWEEVTPTRRGLFETVVRRIEVSDAFGLTRVAFRVTETRGGRFAPSMGALRQVHVVRSIAGGDSLSHPAGPPEGERIDMRHYAQGDPIKFILWKVYARTRQLVVRTPERAIAPVRQTVAYVVTGPRDEPAAGAARVAVDSGALGSDWVLGADGNDSTARTPAQAIELLARSANTPVSNGGAGLARFLDHATPGGTSRAVVFVPSTPGPWLDAVISSTRSRGDLLGSPVEFVVCTDGITHTTKPSLFARLTLRASTASQTVQNPSPTPGAEVTKVVSALASTRARVMVVDRLAGRVYPDGHYRSPDGAAGAAR